MRKTLEELFYGNLTPNEQQITPDSPLQQAMDQADLWAGQLTGQPLYYELTYHAAEYEAAVAAESVPCLHPDGTAAQLPQGSLLVLAQCYDRGDANITLTDAKGLSVGALRVVVPAA